MQYKDLTRLWSVNEYKQYNQMIKSCNSSTKSFCIICDLQCYIGEKKKHV